MSDSILDKDYQRNKYTLANPDPWNKLLKLKGEDFRAYRELLKKAETGELLTRLPIEVLIKTTLTCNHKCPKCLHGLGIFPSGSAYNMSFETLKKVLDEGAKNDVKSIVFTGGEPTLHPEFIQFLEYADSLHFPDISIVTNGSLLTDEIITAIIDNNVTRINVSLDALTRETYKQAHGVDDFEKVLQNLDNLHHRINKLPLLSISFVLSDETKDELEDFCKKYEPIATGGIKIYPYKNVFSIVDEQFHETYGKGNKKVEETITKQAQRATGDHIMLDNYSIKCTIPWYRCHIGVNGEIQACSTQGFCDHPKMVMGNIHENTFEEAWNSEEWKFLREITLGKRFNEHPVCKKCQASVKKS